MTKKKLLKMGAAMLVALSLAGCAGGGTYYTKIDESALKEEDREDGNPIDLSGAGGMDYSYTLPCFNESGKEQKFTFGVSEPLENGTYVALETQPVRGVVSWKTVTQSDIPEAAMDAIEKDQE